ARVAVEMRSCSLLVLTPSTGCRGATLTSVRPLWHWSATESGPALEFSPQDVDESPAKPALAGDFAVTPPGPAPDPNRRRLAPRAGNIISVPAERAASTRDQIPA